MKISMKGYGENTATFRTDGIVCASHTVKMSENFTVAPCQADDEFSGIAINARNEIACVQLDGYVDVPFSGSAPEVGYCSLVADGNGGVKISAGAREFLVVNVDAVNGTAGIIL